MKENLRKIKKQYKLGKAQPVWKCCREIRLWAYLYEVGDIIRGFNRRTGEYEFESWLVIKKDRRNRNETIVQQIKGSVVNVNIG